MASAADLETIERISDKIDKVLALVERLNTEKASAELEVERLRNFIDTLTGDTRHGIRARRVLNHTFPQT
jgi:hypothetical protein